MLVYCIKFSRNKKIIPIVYENFQQLANQSFFHYVLRNANA